MSPPEPAAPSLILRLFGPFQALLNDDPLPALRRRQAHWLLALLTLRGAPLPTGGGAAGEVERAWLAGMLWPEASETAALKNLRSSLTHLRRTLGPGAGRLRAPTARTLLLDLTDASVDLFAFDAAIARGDAASLREAVALHRGPLLEECATAWALEARMLRGEAYLQALETLAAAALAQGDRAAAEGYLRRAVAADPLRESAQRALMQSLAAGGQYAAALQVYRDLRLLLHQELNAPPDAETTALFQRLQTAAKRGARRQALGSSEASSGAGRPLHNLPLPATTLIGRSQEVAAVRRLLAEDTVRLVTLTGPGGTGKTRLALEVAAGHLDAFDGAVVFVNLAPISDPELTLSAIAGPLGVSETNDRSLLQGVKDYLREKRLLLLLDNFEHLLPAAPVVTELLAGAPGLKVLATSRAALRLRGEHDVPVLPLSLPEPGLALAHEADLASLLSQSPAVELFAERSAAARPDFVLTPENAPAVAEICVRLDGLPLAIELAAAWIRVLSPQALLARLERRLPLLVGGMRDLPARQQTLRDTIAWSYELLNEPERRPFRRLSVFAGGFTLEAAEALCSDFESPAGEPPRQGSEVLLSLADLVEKSLLRRMETAGEPRFNMLETIREYALEQLEARGEAEALRCRHARLFLALAEEAEPYLRSAKRNVGIDRLSREHDNLRAALSWSQSEPGAGELLAGLAGALFLFWFRGGHWAEGARWLEAALRVSEGRVAAKTRARVLHAAGTLDGWYRTEPALAFARLEEAVGIWRACGDNRGLADSLGQLCAMATILKDYPLARAFGEESVALWRELPDRWGLVLSLHYLGNVTVLMGDIEAARSLYEESRTMALELGDRDALARPVSGLAGLARRQGDYAAARALYEETVALRREQRDAHIGGFLDLLAEVTREQGDLKAARSLSEEALEVHQERGFRPGVARSLAGMGTAAWRQGEWRAARSYLQQSLTVVQELGDRQRELEARDTTIMCLEGLAAIAVSENAEEDDDASRARPPGESASNLEWAARFLGAASALREAGSSPLWPMSPAQNERPIPALQAALGDAAFAAAWGQGRTMPLTHVLAQAASASVEFSDASREATGGSPGRELGRGGYSAGRHPPMGGRR